MINYKNDFIKLYEELSILNEAKADKQKLIDFAGPDLAARFEANKKKLKAPENDLYYWIKNKTVAETKRTVTSEMIAAKKNFFIMFNFLECY